MSRFGGLSLVLLTSPAELAEAWSLRHNCYVEVGAISPRADQRFIDRYDLNRIATLFGVRAADGQLVGTVRFALQPALEMGIEGVVSAPEFAVFAEELSSLRVGGRPIASASRLSIRSNHPRRREIAFLLLLGMMEASLELNARWAIATAKGAHLRLYERVLRMTEIAPPRQMPGLAYSYSLMAGDIDREGQEVAARLHEACQGHFAPLSDRWRAEIAEAYEAIPLSPGWGSHA